MPDIRSANGRDASACSCARRSLEAATSFMALVIFCVCLTLPMRLRRSFRLGMGRVQAKAWVYLSNRLLSWPSVVSLSWPSSRTDFRTAPPLASSSPISPCS